MKGRSKKDLERWIAELGLGVVSVLQDGEMSLHQAEADLFNLDTYQALRKARLNRYLLEFMEWGLELEDVAELTPSGLEESYRSMIHLARRVIAQSKNR